MAKGMDVVKSLEELEREIICSVCQEHYNQPKVLPCLHYYCKHCILKLALRTGIDKPFTCPECRKEATLPEGNEENLPTAFFVNRLISSFNTLERAYGKVEVKCEACRDHGAKANAFCRQCAVFVCEKCVESHERMKMFDSHEIVSLQDLKEGRAKDIFTKEPSIEKCTVHKEPLTLHCPDCNDLICRDCALKKHRNHKFEFSAEAAPETRQKLVDELKPLQTIQDNLSHAVEEVQTTRSEIEVLGVSVANTIKTCFEEFSQILETYKQELLGEAERKVKEKMAKLSEQESNLSVASAEIQSVLDYTKQCATHCADNDIMCMHAEISSRIKREVEQNKFRENIEPVEEADIGVEVMRGEDLQELCQTKSKITHLHIDPSRCTVFGEGANTAEVNKIAEFSLNTKLSNNHPKKYNVKIDCQLKSLYNGSSVKCDVDKIGASDYHIHYTPTVRGRHELTVTVNDHQIAGSPFSVFVSIPPTQLGKPVRFWGGIDNPTGITVNSVGELIVTEYEGYVVVLDNKGNRLRNIERSKHAKFQDLRGISVDGEDNIYFVDDTTNTIFKSNKNGIYQEKKVKQVNGPGHNSLAVVGDEVMICEWNSKGTIMVYDMELKYARQIVGTDMGTFSDLSPDCHGKLYVTDINSSIHVFSNTGDFLHSFGCDRNGVKKMKRPVYVCVHGLYVYVTDRGNHNMSVFTTEGEYVTSFGQYGSGEGDFRSPLGVCVDKDGFVYVCDHFNSRIHVL